MWLPLVACPCGPARLRLPRTSACPPESPTSLETAAESAPHERETAHRFAWLLDVPAKGAAQPTYAIRVQRQRRSFAYKR